MKKRFTLILFLALFSFASQNIYASHAIGGELRYTDLGNGVYEITAVIYRDCFGIPMATSIPIEIQSVYLTTILNDTIPMDSSATRTLNNICPGGISTCQGGNLVGVERYVFREVVTLQPAPDWNFRVSICARTAAISNVLSPDASCMTLDASLDNLNTPFNNSPVFSNDPVTQLAVSVPQIINNGIYDPDGDSLVISFTPAMDGNNPLTYFPAYTYNNPILTTGGLTLDPSNGDLILTPSTVEADVVVFLVQEYRNGNLIGTTKREMNISVYISTNNLPYINYTFPFVATACYNDTIDLNIITSDADINDSVFIDSIYSNLPAGYFQYTLTQGLKQSAHLLFYPDSTLVSSSPYIFSIKVRDNSCPYIGAQYYSFRLYTNACGTLVWPGDADADLDADMYDILPIGIGFGSTGAARSNASNNWVGQPATSWGQTFLSGVDYMHADCNGDGIIDNLDMQAVNLNYGQTHPLRKRSNTGSNSVLTDGVLSLSASTDSIYPDSLVTIDINLGDSFNQITSLYGLAFRISFDPQTFDGQMGGMQFLNSWIGSTGNLLLFKKELWSQGIVDVVISRVNGTNVSGSGLIGQLILHAKHTALPGAPAVFSLSGLKAITYSQSVINMAMQDDSVLVAATPTGILPKNSSQELKIFPNPVKAGTAVQIMNERHFTHVRIYNACGMTMFEKENQSDIINIDSDLFKSGMYFIELSNRERVFTGKLLIFE